jgi:DNA ligase (NAD+)
MPATHTEALALVKSVGLPTIESRTVYAADVLPAIETLNQRRMELPFPTDGIVVRVDDHKTFERLGATSHHPRGALARKYKETPVETQLLSVEWTRGSTGKLTPVARFKPVEVQGATVQRATLHNLDHIRAMDLRIGDWIQVIRAGGTVPEIIGICPDRRTGKETPVPDPPQGL